MRAGDLVDVSLVQVLEFDQPALLRMERAEQFADEVDGFEFGWFVLRSRGQGPCDRLAVSLVRDGDRDGRGCLLLSRKAFTRLSI
jgi:hypothetical protein